MWEAGVFFLLISLLFFFLFHTFNTYKWRWLWGAGVFLFLLSIGIFMTAFHSENITVKESGKAYVYVGTVFKKPREKAKSILCTVRLELRRDSAISHSDNHKILLYLPKDSVSRKVDIGDRLVFYSKISAPHNNGNPDEFDYSGFLFHKGIGGTAYVSARDWKLLSHRAAFGFRKIASDCREKILRIYNKLGFENDEFAVLSALTLGYKDELSEDVRQAYSISGVSHLLALSGLHVGLLFVLLDFLLAWMNKNKLSRLFKQLIIIGSLWLFAFMTGLPSSVIRSVGMFSLLAISGIFGGRSVTLNTLAVAAFFMLIFDPFYLYDVSFQLSFLSVAGIVIIQPWLYKKIKTENRVLRYLWGMATVSIAAQISTAPLVIYYFSSFPVHFIWTNLLAIPLVTLILYVSIVMLISGFCFWCQALIALILLELVRLLNVFTSFVEKLPAASINNIRFVETDVFFVYLLIVFGVFYLFYRKRKILLMALSSLLILCVFHVKESFLADNRPFIIFYNNRSCPSVHFVCSTKRSYLLSTQNDSVIEKLNYATERFWRKRQITTPFILPREYENIEIYNHGGITGFGNKTVCLLADDRWRNKESEKLFPVDYLYVCNGYKGRITYLTKLFKVRKVVLDSSLPEYRLIALKEECSMLGLDFISISEKGSYRIDL